jgi:hypothetical protein
MQSDIACLFNSNFDRIEQLELVASTLEHLRTTYPTKWERLGNGERVPEFKALVSRLIRSADESVDHQATVAFATKAVLDELESIASARQPRRVYKSDLKDAKRFSHEHATPVEVVLRTVTLHHNLNSPIFDILNALCCRVLVTRAERIKIDSKHAWTVPSLLNWTTGFGFGVRTLTPALLPLIRYYQVDPALALTLVPLSSAHKELATRFHKLMSACKRKEIMEGYAACKREPKTKFSLSDEIYQGTARVRGSRLPPW